MTAPNPFHSAADILERDASERAALGHLDWKPLDYQRAPQGAWDWWMLNAGRGTGKTDAAAFWLDQHVKGPPCMPGIPGGHRPAIVAPTLGDAAESCVDGVSGLRAHNPSIRLVTQKGGTFAIWPNGAKAKLFGAFTPEDVERLRAGGNRCCAWLEELAAWRQLADCWDHVRFGLRIGQHPRGVITTTPKLKPLIKDLLSDTPPVNVVVTRIADPDREDGRGWRYPNMDDNPHLPEHVRRELLKTYAGTRIGQQELFAELLDVVVGALWTPEDIEPYRIRKGLSDEETAEAMRVLNQLRRIVVAIDPSWGTKGDEVGIGVAGVGWDHRGYVLEDASGRMTPLQWGARGVELYHGWKADRLLSEINFQGEQVRLVMLSTDPTVPVKEVSVTRGKQLRAEPVVALYQQGKISHVGEFPGLEEQMLTWVPEEAPADFSPDRVDWLTMAITDLMLTGLSKPAGSQSAAGHRLPI